MFALTGVDGDDDDDIMIMVVVEKKNVVMTLHTAVNSYNPTLFMFYRRHVFVSQG